MRASLLENRRTGLVLISRLDPRLRDKRRQGSPCWTYKRGGLHEYVYPHWGPSDMEMQGIVMI